MSLTVQVLFTGLSAGGVYGLVAIGHSLIYRLTGIVHFALGDLIGFGAFVTLLVAAGTQPLTQESVSGGRMALGIVVGLVACVLLGAAGYVAVVQPYIGRSAVGARLAVSHVEQVKPAAPISCIPATQPLSKSSRHASRSSFSLKGSPTCTAGRSFFDSSVNSRDANAAPASPSRPVSEPT